MQSLSQSSRAGFSPRRRGVLLKGCMIALAVVMVMATIGAVIAYIYWPNLMASWSRNIIQQTVAEWNLPENQKGALLHQTERVLQAYENGQLTGRQASEIVERVGKSPIQYIGLLYMVQVRYIMPSDLSEEDKAHATRILDRGIRAFSHEMLTNEQGDELARLIARDPNARRVSLPDTLSNERLMDFVAALEEKMRDMEVPDTGADLAGILERIIDERFAEYGITES